MAEEFNHFSEIAAKLPKACSQIIRKVAFDVQAGYQLGARRDTGAQVNSAYVVTSNNESTYEEAATKAKAANPKVKLLPEIAQPTGIEADVAVGVEYALINEVGGAHHTGDGAMTKAAEAQRQPMISAFSQLEKLLQ